jgi:uncharacterized protein YbjT (DUF2867 family)
MRKAGASNQYKPNNKPTNQPPRQTKGVLTFKREAELALEASGLPWTVLRPSRLTDGPYTSYDLNTLLKATAGTRRDAVLSPADDLAGEASRITVAEAVVQALALPGTEGRAYAIESKEGEGPGGDAGKWDALFAACDAKRANKAAVTAAQR